MLSIKNQTTLFEYFVILIVKLHEGSAVFPVELQQTFPAMATWQAKLSRNKNRSSVTGKSVVNSWLPPL